MPKTLSACSPGFSSDSGALGSSILNPPSSILETPSSVAVVRFVCVNATRDGYLNYWTRVLCLLPCICSSTAAPLLSPSSVFLKLFVRHEGDAFPAFLFVLCAIFCVAPLCWYFYVFWQIALARKEDAGWVLCRCCCCCFCCWWWWAAFRADWFMFISCIFQALSLAFGYSTTRKQTGRNWLEIPPQNRNGLTYEHSQTEEFGVQHPLRGKVQTCLRVNLSNSTLGID